RTVTSRCGRDDRSSELSAECERDGMIRNTDADRLPRPVHDFRHLSRALENEAVRSREQVLHDPIHAVMHHSVLRQLRQVLAYEGQLLALIHTFDLIELLDRSLVQEVAPEAIDG